MKGKKTKNQRVKKSDKAGKQPSDSRSPLLKREKIGDALHKEGDFFAKILNYIRDPIFVKDSNHRLILVNDAECDLAGHPRGELLGKTDYDFFPKEQVDIFWQKDDEVLATGKENINEEVITDARGQQRTIVTRKTLYTDQAGNKYIVGIIRDITERKQGEQAMRDANDRLDLRVKERTEALEAINRQLQTEIFERRQSEEKIITMAYYDTLTELPNRYLFKDRLKQAIAAAKQYKRLVAILFLDLDNFKRVNDTLGHEMGDQLLQSVSERLLNFVRRSDTIARVSESELVDTVARLGGDEFTILLTEIAHIEDVAKVAQRILYLFSKPFKISDNELFISSSIGISVYPDNGDDIEALLKNADTAMYHAKDQGRNNFQFYTESMNVAILERFTLESKLRKAIKSSELLLYYQPQVDIRRRTIFGVEALVRWMHPDKGLLSPGAFVPLAEDTGLIVPIGEWVLRTACAQNKAWHAAGFEQMQVTVNISSTQFRQENFLETVTKALHDTGMDPSCLELELTESIFMETTETTINTLKILKAAGARISIDDFGTGYSSLSYLKRFPIDTLKIDRAFVKDITTDPDDRAIVKAIIAMSHSLNLRVVAEGVETVQQLSLLSQQGSDGIQGHLFSPPLPPDAFIELLKKAEKAFEYLWTAL